MDRLQNSYDRIKKKIDDAKCLTRIPKSTAIEKANWNDDLLLEMDTKVHFGSYTRSLGSLKTILTRFFNFYFSGKVFANDTVLATVVDAIPFLGAPRQSVFDDECFSDHTFYGVNKSVPPESLTFKLGPEVAINIEGVLPEKLLEYQELMKVASAEEKATFRGYVETTIAGITGKDLTDDQAIVSALAGYLACTLCRAATKNEAQLGNAFLKKAYSANLTTLLGLPSEKSFCQPSADTIRACCSALQKGMGHTDKVFTKLVGQYTRHALSPENRSGELAYLSASVLTHTARNGLGMIQLMEQACAHLQANWIRLMELTCLSTTISSWDTISDFMATYYSADAQQYSQNWARIIADGYLKGLSPKENTFLGIVLLSILEDYQGAGVWKSEWCKAPRKTHPGAEQYGKLVVEECQTTLDKVTGIGASDALLQKARAADPAAALGTDLNRMLDGIFVN